LLEIFDGLDVGAAVVKLDALSFEIGRRFLLRRGSQRIGAIKKEKKDQKKTKKYNPFLIGNAYKTLPPPFGCFPSY